MKKLQILSYGLVLALLVTTGCSKTAIENQSAADTAPMTADQSPSSLSQTTMADADTTSSSLGAPDTAYQKVDITEAVYFDFDSASLNAINQAALSSKAKWLQDNPQVGSVLIEGHCDERGTDAYNMALGARRADAVKDYLIDLGVANNKLKTQSYGEEKPVDLNHNESAWAKNRRADFVLD